MMSRKTQEKGGGGRFWKWSEGSPRSVGGGLMPRLVLPKQNFRSPGEPKGG